VDRGVQPAVVMLVCVLSLSILGFTVLFSASVSLKADPYFYLSKQLLWFVLAGGACLVVSRMDLEHARRYVWVSPRYASWGCCWYWFRESASRLKAAGAGLASAGAAADLGICQAGDDFRPGALSRAEPDADFRAGARLLCAAGVDLGVAG